MKTITMKYNIIWSKSNCKDEFWLLLYIVYNRWFYFWQKRGNDKFPEPRTKPKKISPIYLPTLFKISLGSGSSFPETITFNPKINPSYPQGFGAITLPWSSKHNKWLLWHHCDIANIMRPHKLAVLHPFKYSHPWRKHTPKCQNL